MPAYDLESLCTFRRGLHGCFARRADALFELGDALLAVDPADSLPHLSLQAAHRRGWGSLYDALAAGRIDVEALRAALAQYPVTDRQPVYAIDLSVWPRCDAEASPARGFYYHPSRHSAGQWAGQGDPDLDLLWRAYVRRFDLEHTLRFCKQRLGWTMPRVRHPEQADRWTWLVVAVYTQLRLARSWISDHRLPWERPRDLGQLTPSRVRRALSALLPIVGTPASAPKPCGRSPGRPTGSRSGRAIRYPALKKAA